MRLVKSIGALVGIVGSRGIAPAVDAAAAVAAVAPAARAGAGTLRRRGGGGDDAALLRAANAIGGGVAVTADAGQQRFEAAESRQLLETSPNGLPLGNNEQKRALIEASGVPIVSSDWMSSANGVSLPSETEIVLSSNSLDGSDFGVVLTAHAFDDSDVDFQVRYTQTSFVDLQGGYESQLYVFFVPGGTNTDDLLQNDNDFGDFKASTVGYLRSKIHATIDHTWFDAGTGKATTTGSVGTKHLELTLRIRRLDNQIVTYYRVPGNISAWVDIGQPMAIPQEMHDVPLQFGCRVKKEWKQYHDFSLWATKLAGGPPLPIPTNIGTDDWAIGGNGVEFPSDAEVVLHSESSGSSEFGVVLTKHAFNDADVDFRVDYAQTSYANLQGGYESQLCVFFASQSTDAEDLLQTDNNFGKFESTTVGYLKSKVFTTMDHTWFNAGTGEAVASSSTNIKHLELTLRIRRLDDQVHAYYQVPGGSSARWVDVGQPMAIPQEMHGVPVRFGLRVKKEYKKYHNFSVRATKLAGGPPLTIASPQTTQDPTHPPTPLPTPLPTPSPVEPIPAVVINTDDWMIGGNGVSFPSDAEVVLQSDSSQISQFGVVVTKHAFNDADVDFQVDYAQTSYANVQSGYESQLCTFFVPEGTYPDTLLQADNNFGGFIAATVGYIKNKIFTTADNTWFNAGTVEATASSSTNTKHLELTLRIRRLNNEVYTYYQVPGSSAWIDIGQPMAIPQEMYDVPLQFGFRIKKEYQQYHQFSVQAKKLAGGPPLPIPPA